MPSGAHSAASDLVSWCTAALEALYAGCHWGRLTICAEIEPMLTMLPRPSVAKCRAAVWLISHSPSTLVEKTSRHSSGPISRAGLW